MTKKLTSLRAKPLAQEYAEAAVDQNAERDALEWVEQEVGASLADEDSVAGRAIRRGEVWWIALDPSVGGEIRKTRPAVVISNDDANTHHNRIQVMPLTGRTTRPGPGKPRLSSRVIAARPWPIRSVRWRRSASCNAWRA